MDTKTIDKAIAANIIAQQELQRQRAALDDLLHNRPIRTDDLLLYAPRMQQAAVMGALVRFEATGEAPPLTC